jgi:hypothetical protein
VRAGLLRLPGQLDGVPGVVGADPGEDSGPVAASTTARIRRSFSASVVVGDSPVVPFNTSASLPCSSTRCWASRAAPSRSSDPSAVNGVTMAVISRPNGRDAPRSAAAGWSCVMFTT